jgi:hypothetical protein
LTSSFGVNKGERTFAKTARDTSHAHAWLSTGPGPGVLVEGPTDEIKESDRGPEDDKLDR